MAAAAEAQHALCFRRSIGAADVAMGKRTGMTPCLGGNTSVCKNAAAAVSEWLVPTQQCAASPHHSHPNRRRTLAAAPFQLPPAPSRTGGTCHLLVCAAMVAQPAQQAAALALCHELCEAHSRRVCTVGTRALLNMGLCARGTSTIYVHAKPPSFVLRCGPTILGGAPGACAHSCS